MAALVLIAFGAWAFRLSQGQGHSWVASFKAWPPARLSAQLRWPSSLTRTGRPDQKRRPPRRAGSEAFSHQKLHTLLASGKPVFVNMTAAWCLTCLVNERTTLSTGAVRETFAGKRIAHLKGDCTNRNPETTRLLEKFGLSGVPLYVLYRAGPDPLLLPQILTQSLVLEALEKSEVTWHWNWR